MAVLFWLGLLVTIFCTLKQVSDNTAFTKDHRARSKEMGDLVYWDYADKKYRMIDTHEACYKIPDYDDEHNPYNIYIKEDSAFNKGKSTFIAAKYDMMPNDPPVRFTRERIDFMLKHHWIYDESELYKRWEGKEVIE